MSGRLMNIKEVASYFGVTTRTIQNFLVAEDEQKRLKGFKLGNKWMFEESDLEDFKKRMREATQVKVHTS